jgi:asparagine synthase (glutamine-hydrolysing)
MCGIAFSVNFPFSEALVNQTMQHRGPDAQNGYTQHNVQLHHLRLSILDIQGGSQPMHYLNRYTIVFNGEIYNYKELIQSLGLQTSTRSDTEVLLQAYHKVGAAMLQHLDGMFVFAIADFEQKELFIARDRAGKKPLYYWQKGEQMVFASELNCLQSLVKDSIHSDALASYVRIGFVPGNQTPYTHIKEFPKASYMRVSTASMQTTIQQWWQVADYYTQPSTSISLNDAVEQTAHLLQLGIQRRLESADIEVGAFLSGGIDSGLITAFAAQLKPRLQTFTVAFKGAYNEAPLAHLVAQQYGTRHQVIEIDFDHLPNEIETILQQYGEPFFDSSCIPSYYVSKAAKKQVTVVLNGDGADELFGGYRRYVPFSRYNFYKPAYFVKASAGLINQLLPPAHEKKSGYNYVKRLMSLAAVEGVDAYLRAGTDLFEGFTQHLSFTHTQGITNLTNQLNDVFALPIPSLHKIMLADFETSLYNMLLVKMDIATMAHSLEGRSPFLSKELLQWAPQLPPSYKIKGGVTKVLLRKMAAKWLPPAIESQPKRGFEIPLKDWVNGLLKPIIDHYLWGNPSAIWPHFVQKHFVQDLYQSKVPVSAEKRAKMLWNLFCLEVWHAKQP